jgi:hypothetical protein
MNPRPASNEAFAAGLHERADSSQAHMNTRPARGLQQGDANFLWRHAAIHLLGNLRLDRPE